MPRVPVCVTGRLSGAQTPAITSRTTSAARRGRSRTSYDRAARTQPHRGPGGTFNEWPAEGSVFSGSEQRYPDTEVPITPTAEHPVEDRNDHEGVIAERAEIDLRDEDVARWPVPTAVPAAGRRRTVPAPPRWRAVPVGWRAAGWRSVIPTEPSLPRRRRRAVAHDAEADRRIYGTANFRSTPNEISVRNEGRVRRLGARRSQRLVLCAGPRRALCAGRGGASCAGPRRARCAGRGGAFCAGRGGARCAGRGGAALRAGRRSALRSLRFGALRAGRRAALCAGRRAALCAGRFAAFATPWFRVRRHGGGGRLLRPASGTAIAVRTRWVQRDGVREPCVLRHCL